MQGIRKPKKVMIIIEDAGIGDSFNLYISGDIDLTSPPSEMSPAQYWGSRLFKLCTAAVQEIKVLRNKNTKELKSKNG